MHARAERSLDQAIAEVRENAREQLSAAWQLETERLNEQLAAAWSSQVAQVFDQRFADLLDRLRDTERAAREQAQRQITATLSQAARRLRTFEGEGQWSRTLVDATNGFCGRAALFVVNGRSLRLEAMRGIASEAKVDNTPLDSAPAFAGAVESRDPVVALRTAGELSPPIAGLLGEAPDRRFHLFPIRARDRVAAILYADTGAGDDAEKAAEEALDPAGLELLATFASVVLESQAPPATDPRFVSIATGAKPAPPVSSWFALSREDQEAHLKAQRFARVQAAEMRLYKSDAVTHGRSHRNVYGALKADIDRARDVFRRDFLSASPTMVDYLHLELVRTLANDDADLLGKDYPGAMA